MDWYNDPRNKQKTGHIKLDVRCSTIPQIDVQQEKTEIGFFPKKSQLKD